MADRINKSLSAGLKGARAQMGISQEEMSDRIGISVEFYARMERGKSLPSVHTLVAMCQVTGQTADALLRSKEVELASALAGNGTALAPALVDLIRRLKRSPPTVWRAVNQVLNAIYNSTPNEGGHREDTQSDEGDRAEDARSD